jgi:hypothetical protein
MCVSSCANYLFLGSRCRKIQNGIVGYHGNITALLEKDPESAGLKKQPVEAKVTAEQLEKIVKDFSEQQKRFQRLNNNFFL